MVGQKRNKKIDLINGFIWKSKKSPNDDELKTKTKLVQERKKSKKGDLKETADHTRLPREG